MHWQLRVLCVVCYSVCASAQVAGTLGKHIASETLSDFSNHIIKDTRNAIVGEIVGEYRDRQRVNDQEEAKFNKGIQDEFTGDGKRRRKTVDTDEESSGVSLGSALQSFGSALSNLFGSLASLLGSMFTSFASVLSGEEQEAEPVAKQPARARQEIAPIVQRAEPVADVYEKNRWGLPKHPGAKVRQGAKQLGDAIMDIFDKNRQGASAFSNARFNDKTPEQPETEPILTQSLRGAPIRQHVN